MWSPRVQVPHPVYGVVSITPRRHNVRAACTLSQNAPYTSYEACQSGTPCGWQYTCSLTGACTASNVPAGTTGYAAQSDCLNQCKTIIGVKCNAADAAIYHANTSTKVLRGYPNMTVYTSWGAPPPQVIDCTGYTYGPAMTTKP